MLALVYDRASSARAQAAQALERAAAFPYSILCPWCLAPCGGATPDEADQGYAAHVMSVHLPDRAALINT